MAGLKRYLVPALIAALLLSGVFVFESISSGMRNPAGPAISEDIQIRLAALRYAFDHESSKDGDRAKWVYVVNVDTYTDEVLARLSEYPVAKNADETVDGEHMISRIEKKTGRRVVYWSIKVDEVTATEARAMVECVAGGLNGEGRVFLLKKKNGVWSVVSTKRTWIS